MIPLEPQPVPMLYIYATGARRSVLEGNGRNGPFATALTRHLATPGLELKQLFVRVRDDVVRATNRRQEPWVRSSLRGGVLYFVAPNTR